MIPKPFSAALPIAHLALRLLIVLNWLFGVFILVLLSATFVDGPWMMKALGISHYPQREAVMTGMRAIAALGLGGIGLNDVILKRLVAMVATVRAGDPFVAANADRLNAIAWVLLALQLLSLIVAGIAEGLSTAEHPLDLDAGFSVSGWLAVILTFVLARVFAEGTLMRDDLEGTV